MRQGEICSASSSASSLFLIGKNSHGHWIAQDQRGLRGGLFVSRAEAIKFAHFENGNRPELVVTVPGLLELDMSGNAFASSRSSPGADAAVHRLAA